MLFMFALVFATFAGASTQQLPGTLIIEARSGLNAFRRRKSSLAIRSF